MFIWHKVVDSTKRWLVMTNKYSMTNNDKTRGSCTKLCDALYDQLTGCISHKLILLTNCYIALGCVPCVAPLCHASGVALVRENRTYELDVRTSLWKTPWLILKQTQAEFILWHKVNSHSRILCSAPSVYSTRASKQPAAGPNIMSYLSQEWWYLSCWTTVTNLSISVTVQFLPFSNIMIQLKSCIIYSEM